VIVDNGSPELRLILRDMLKYSTNLTAEVVGLTSSGATGRRAANLNASGRQMGNWLQSSLGANRARFSDHSGLNDTSRISASDMVRTLVRVGPGGPLRPILKEMQLKDENNRARADQTIEIRAKTGTLNFVSALAGYAKPRNGRELAFAIFTADTNRRAALRPGDRERPEGARGWSARSRRMQLKMIERWGAVYS